MNDTTELGVSDDTNKGATDRDNAISDIAKNAQKTRVMEEAGVDINNPMEVNLALQKMEDGQDPDPNAGKVDPYSVESLEKDNEKEPEKILVKINGVEKMALKSEVDEAGGVTAYQKMNSADERMRQNAAERKRIDEDSAALDRRELAIAGQEEALLNKNTESELSTDAPVVSDKAKAIKEKMYSGNEEKTQEGVQDLLDAVAQATATPELNTQEIVDQTAAQVQRGIDLNQATKDFASVYSDIDSNPEYRSYANDVTKAVMAEHPEWTPGQILTEAGEQARLKFSDELGQAEREKEAQREEDARLEHKRATDTVQGTNAQPAKAPAPKALNPSEIVKNLQKGRSHAVI